MLDYSLFQDVPQIPEDRFQVMPYEDGVLVTHCFGNEQMLKIPQTIGGKKVLAVGALKHSFQSQCYDLLLPPTVKALVAKQWPQDWAEHICIHPENPNFAQEEGLLMSADRRKVFMRSDSALTQIRIPDTVREICPGAFASGLNIEHIHLGAGITTIGKRAFPNSQAGAVRFHGRHNGSYKKLAFRAITVAGENPCFAARDGFLYSKDHETLVQAPEIIPGGIFQVPADVKRIAPEAFLRNQGIRILRADHPLESIGERVFEDCFQLETAELAEVGSVEMEAFHECEGLTKLHIGTAGSLGFRAFSGCHKLSQLILENVRAIESSAFSGCWALEKAVLPGSLQKLGEGAFLYAGTKGLDIVLPDTVSLNPGKAAYDWEFSEDRWACGKHSVTVVSAEDRRVLYSVYMGQNNGTSSQYREAAINGWEKYPDFDFERLDAAFSTLRETEEKVAVSKLRLTYPVSLAEETRKQYTDYLRRMAKKLLAQCAAENDTQTVQFLAGLGILKRDAVDGAVAQCDGTKHPEMMALLLSLQTSAAGKPSDPTKMPTDTAMLKKLWSTQKLPDGTLELTSYKGSEEQVFVPSQIGKAAVTRLGDNVMNLSEASKAKAANLRQVKSVVIPEGIVSIGAEAFTGCKGITEIQISDSVREIGERAFSDCSGLVKIHLPPGLKRLENGIFRGCTCLTEVAIPAGVAEIGRGAFGGCAALTGMEIPPSVVSIGENAFSGCVGLQNADGFVVVRDTLYQYCGEEKEVAVPAHIRRIGDGAFENKKNLEQIFLPEVLETLGYSAFSGCAKLRAIDIPQSVKKLQAYVFQKCVSLEQVNLPDTLCEVGMYLFAGCKAIRTLRLPEGLQKIPYAMFAGCAALETLTVPCGVTEIQYEAFKNCKSLQHLYLPSSVVTISWGTFDGCKALTIHAPAGSYAETYAKENNIPFVAE